MNNKYQFAWQAKPARIKKPRQESQLNRGIKLRK
jgi:hypothetical protein